MLDVLRSGRLSLGPALPAFEEAFAARLGVAHASAVSSGTAGLHLALRAVGVSEGDEVVTTPFSFVASANAIVYERARPVFADIDPVTLNLDPQAAAAAVTERTTALLPVHIFGYPADLPAFERMGLPIVEDACEALGAVHADGVPVGGRGHPAAFAFYANKQITTGEGGMVTTGDRRSRTASTPSETRAERWTWAGSTTTGWGSTTASPTSPARSASPSSSASTACSPTARAWRAPTGRRWRESRVSTCSARTGGAERRGWFVYVVLLPPDADQRETIAALAARGIQTRPYLPPIHLMSYYRETFGHREGEFPVSEAVGARSVALPFFPAMTEGQVARVAEALGAVLGARQSAAHVGHEAGRADPRDGLGAALAGRALGESRRHVEPPRRLVLQRGVQRHPGEAGARARSAASSSRAAGDAGPARPGGHRQRVDVPGVLRGRRGERAGGAHGRERPAPVPGRDARQREAREAARARVELRHRERRDRACRTALELGHAHGLGAGEVAAAGEERRDGGDRAIARAEVAVVVARGGQVEQLGHAGIVRTGVAKGYCHSAGHNRAMPQRPLGRDELRRRQARRVGALGLLAAAALPLLLWHRAIGFVAHDFRLDVGYLSGWVAVVADRRRPAVPDPRRLVGGPRPREPLVPAGPQRLRRLGRDALHPGLRARRAGGPDHAGPAQVARSTLRRPCRASQTRRIRPSRRSTPRCPSTAGSGRRTSRSRARTRAMLAARGIISARTATRCTPASTRSSASSTDGSFPFRDDDEDIHMAIERRLTEIAGPVGGKLHTARSRNDQVATDVAMYVREHARAARDGVRALQGALVDLAERHADWPMPGYTHLQRAQPVYLGHHLLAYFWMLERDARALRLRRGRGRPPAPRRRRARRRELRHRPPRRGAPRWASTPWSRTRSTRSPTATSSSTT